MYSWQSPNWPNYEFDSTLHQTLLLKYAENSGRLAAIADLLNAQGNDQAYIEALVDEAVNTSKIENEHLARDDVRSSIRHYMGLVPEIRNRDQRADGIVAALMDLRKHVAGELTHERLKIWHSQVMYGTQSLLYTTPLTGEYRVSAEAMQIVSGPVGSQTVHYEAPPSCTVPEEMDAFLDWYNKSSELPAPVRAAVAHLWFETIHPFDDGNGRVGRAIAEHALAQGMGNMPSMSLSLALEKNRAQYYPHLHDASMGESLNIDKFVSWFTEQCVEAQQLAQARFDMVIVKAGFWHEHSTNVTEKNQTKALNKFFDAGLSGFVNGLSSQKYAALAACSRSTATRHLTELTQKGVLVRLEGGGRSTRYAPNVDRLFELMPTMIPNPIYKALSALKYEPPGETSERLEECLDSLNSYLVRNSVSSIDATAIKQVKQLINELDDEKFYAGKLAREIEMPPM